MIQSARIRGVLAPVVTPFKADLSPDGERFIAHCIAIAPAMCDRSPWRLNRTCRSPQSLHCNTGDWDLNDRTFRNDSSHS